MNIDNFIGGFSGGRMAKPEDNQKILNFYNSFSMEGGAFKIAFRKEPDYFRFLSYESPKHHVFLMENNDKEIEAMASMIVRPCYINGEVDRVAHISDLRVVSKAQRKNKFRWRDFSLAICEQGEKIREFEKCRYYLGSYVDANKQAKDVISSFDAPYATSDVANYRMVSLLARKLPKVFGRKSSVSDLKITITRAREEDREELKGFLDRQSRKRTFGYVYSGKDGELERRIRDWDGFTIASFYVARNTAGTIIGCCAPWDPTTGRRIVVDTFPGSLVFLAKVVKLLGKNVPDPGDELKTLYLTTMEYDYSLSTKQKRHILNAMIDEVYKTGIMKEYHVLAFCDYKKESIAAGLKKDYFVESTSTVLYQLHARDSEEVIRESELAVPPGHEMCLT
ncbi:MAG: hypothetical protein GY754_28965 [bacterium]|nr:hypothetical protein [bacterium]